VRAALDGRYCDKAACALRSSICGVDLLHQVRFPQVSASTIRITPFK